MMPANHKLKVLFVVNKILPDSDYRLAYGEYSKVCEVVYGLPKKTESLSEARYVKLGFEEGLDFGVLGALWDLYSYLRQNRKQLSLVHFFTTNPILFGSIVAKISKVPAIVTVTGFGRVMTNDNLKYRLLRPVYSALFYVALLFAERILFQNRPDMANFLKKYPSFANKSHYVGSTSRMTVIDAKDFSQPELTVFLGTRLLPDKGISDFIAVARQLQKSGFRFVLAGPPSKGFESLMDDIWQAHEEGVIIYKGELDTPSMEIELFASHILFFPSHYGEGLSRIMIEAGFAKLCPIAYDISSNRDLIFADNGFIVSVGDLSGVINILKTLYTQRMSLADNANAYQDHIIKNFGLMKFVQNIDEIFTQWRIESNA